MHSAPAELPAAAASSSSFGQGPPLRRYASEGGAGGGGDAQRELVETKLRQSLSLAAAAQAKTPEEVARELVDAILDAGLHLNKKGRQLVGARPARSRQHLAVISPRPRPDAAPISSISP